MGDLETVIVNLLHGRFVTENNELLSSFIVRDDAWQPTMDLFVSDKEEVRYFAANMLYGKLKKEVENASNELLGNVFQFLQNIIDSFSQYYSFGEVVSTSLSNTNKAFFNKVFLSLCVICCQSPDGINMYIEMAMTKVQAVDSSIENDIGLEMLYTMPDELRDISLRKSDKTSSEMQDSLMSWSTRVLTLFESYCAEVLSVLITENLTTPKIGTRLLVNSTKVLHAWFSFGITISELYESYPNSLSLITVSWKSGNSEWIRACCYLLKDVVETKEYPRSPKRDEAVITITNHITESLSDIHQFFQIQQKDDGEIVYDICSCLSAIVVEEIDLLILPIHFQRDLFDFLLHCAAFKPRKIAYLTFDIWCAIQEISIQDKHPFATEELYTKLLQIIIEQVKFSDNTIVSLSEEEEIEVDYGLTDDEDDFLTFRDTRYGIKEVIDSCFYALNPEKYIYILQEYFSHTSTDFKWRLMESLFFVLENTMGDLKSLIESQNSERNSVKDFLKNILEMIFAIPFSQISKTPLLERTMASVLGSFTFILTSPTESEFGEHFFVPSLMFLFQSMEHPYARNCASKSIFKLCIHGKSIFLSTIGTGESLIAQVTDATTQIMGMQNIEESAPVLSIIEAVTRVLMALLDSDNSERIQSCISNIGGQIINVLSRKVSCGQEKEIVLNLQFASQLIRFSDTQIDFPEFPQNILHDFLSSLWPLLKELSQIPGKDILDSVFDVYSRAVMSASGIIISEIPNITSAVVAVFQGRNQSSSASLHCANNIVEALSNKKSEEINDFLMELLECCVEVLGTYIVLESGTDLAAEIASRNLDKDEYRSTYWEENMDALVNFVLEFYSSERKEIFGYEPDCIENFFRFLYSYLIFFPHIVAKTKRLPEIINVCLLCLVACKENAPLRHILKVVQLFFDFLLLAKRKNEIAETEIENVLSEISQRGNYFTIYLLKMLDSCDVGTTSLLWPNVIDTLYKMLTAFNGTQMEDDYKFISQKWFLSSIKSHDNFDFLNDNNKDFFLEKMFHFADFNKKKFKLIMMDLAKIGAKESEVSVLLDHEIE